MQKGKQRLKMLPKNRSSRCSKLLNSLGANIKGAGTSTLKISGVEELHGAEYQVIPDRIEAGTYMCIAAACGDEVTIKILYLNI